MARYKIIVYPTDVIYVYDGSLAGFFSCVHESFYGKELPLEISVTEPEQVSLCAIKAIVTDEAQASRVRESIKSQLSHRILTLIEHVFLCTHPTREMKLLHFLVKAFREGKHVIDLRGDEVVKAVLALEDRLLRERHLLLGFVRFKDYGQVLGATIAPEHFVLPLLAPHFLERMPNEAFMIYDEVHQVMLTAQGGQVELRQVDHLQFAPDSETEVWYQGLWRQFYHTVAIKERVNHKRRMGFMPKKYWGHLTEMQ